MTNFTVILSERQHFGSDPSAFGDVEPGVPFVGGAKDFIFDCPDVDAGETAYLMLQSRDVGHRKNVFQVNGADVAGGLPASPARNAWNSNILLIETQQPLKPTGNVLHIEARTSHGEASGDLDDFIVDNVVVVYKVADLWTLPSATGDLAAFLKNELLRSIPGVKGAGRSAEAADQRNEYVIPTPPQLAGWRAVFHSLLAGFWVDAHHKARLISSTYNVVRFLDTPSGRTYFILMEGVPGYIPAAATHATGVSIIDPADPTRRGWGTYAFDPQPERAMSVSAPHPKDDIETEDQAVEAYLELRGRQLLLAGTDRDQNKAGATCARSNRPYLEADVSHTAETVFQMAFEAVYSADAVTWHLQFHGNALCAEDVFLSNGVTPPPAMLQTLAVKIQKASEDAANGGPKLTARVFDSAASCEARGKDNMQMRFASGLSHASICAEANVPAGPSRFIHVEQSRIARRAANDSEASPGQNRGVVIAGIRATFP